MQSIIHVIFPGPFGGAEKLVLMGLQALEKALGVELLIIMERRYPRFAEDYAKRARKLGINCRVLSCHGRVDIGLWRALRAISNSSKPSLVHCHGYKASLYGLWAFAGRKVVTTLHGTTSHNVATKIYEWLFFRSLPLYDGVISVSSEIHEKLQKRRIPDARRCLITNMASFPREAARRESYDGSKQALKILFVGRVSPEKGLVHLIESLEVLALDFRLTVVGAGECLEDCRERVKAARMEDRVLFAGFQDDIKGYLRGSHLLVIPSLREGLPLTLLEAAASCIPVVCSRVGGMPEVMEIYKAGVLTEPGDAGSLAEAIERVGRQYEAFKLTASHNVAKLAERFGEKAWLDRTLNFYSCVYKDHS